MIKKVLNICALALILSATTAQSVIAADFLSLDSTALDSSIKRKKIDRGIKQLTYISKGTWFGGGSVGYSSVDSKDFKFLILEDMTANAHLITARALVGYAFRDDVAAGVSFEYSRTLANLGKIDINLGDDLTMGINDFYSIQQIYTGTAFLRTYINIGSSRRFAMYNDLKISFGGGQGKVISGTGDALVGTYQKIQNVGLLLSPGISLFATDFMAVEASVGLLGLKYSRTEQITNQVYVGSFETVDASFKVNLFSLALGVTFYF